VKATITKRVEVEVKTIVIDIAPRYVGDGPDDDMHTSTPMLVGEKWVAHVDIDTGQIEEWPEGETADIHVKVCDRGVYKLLDENQVEVARIDGYVPNSIVPGSYGDYVELKIDSEGIITNWPKHPILDEFFDE